MIGVYADTYGGLSSGYSIETVRAPGMEPTSKRHREAEDPVDLARAGANHHHQVEDRSPGGPDVGGASESWVGGAAYESYVGRWSRPVAAEFLSWLHRPVGLRWLDLGCGTGALSNAIAARCTPSSVVGVDRSAGYIEWAGAHVSDPRVSFQVADIAALPSGPYDVVVSGLVVNFLADPAAAVTVLRSATPAGVVAAYVWDYADGS